LEGYLKGYCFIENMEELTTTKYFFVFLVIVLGYIAMSCMAVAMEGKTGGIFGKKHLFGLSADAWIFFVMVPLFLCVSLIVNGLDSKLLGTIILGMIVGGVLEDFFWFVFNPDYGIAKFNPTGAPWLPWMNLGVFSIPSFYLLGIAFAILTWILFIHNSDVVNIFIKKYLP
jgi:hypothetical protein